ncbi:unnamed protein product [Brassica rapa]|uniref:Uncharacterized protein n=2 Tax=Brassica TaxID=3705 RepID=A0A8D9GUE1_BRACM|nr:unnamed protein product [Brassica rapa]
MFHISRVKIELCLYTDVTILLCFPRERFVEILFVFLRCFKRF